MIFRGGGGLQIGTHMSDVNRRSLLIGIVARYPEIRKLATRGMSSAELTRRFRFPLGEPDLLVLASIQDSEIEEAETALAEPFAEVFPYGI